MAWDARVRDCRPGGAGPRNTTSELAASTVNFVVEQTGYPAEMVELEADLEADLGIDSIKKAQLWASWASGSAGRKSRPVA